MGLEMRQPQRYWSEIYKDTHIAALFNMGAYSVYFNKTCFPVERFEKLEDAQKWLRDKVDLPWPDGSDSTRNMRYYEWTLKTLEMMDNDSMER